MTLDDMLKHKVELSNLGMLGIHLRLDKARCVYFDKTGIVIEMEDGSYLTKTDMMKYAGKETYSRNDYTYDGVVGWIGKSDPMKDAP